MLKQVATVVELHIFPIKSCAGLQVDRALVTKHGLALVDNPQISDRKWMIVDRHGSFQTQRQLSRMALVKVRLDGEALVLSADSMPNEIRVSIKPPTAKRSCRVWESHLVAHSYGGEVAAWLSQCLEKENLDLVVFSDEVESRKLIRLEPTEQAVAVKATDEVVYADYAPFMLLSDASLADLNSRLQKPVNVKNFRPNIFVSGCHAFEEDTWSAFQISDVKFRNIKQGTRCVLTTVDPIRGSRDEDGEPLKTLKTYRQNVERYGPSPLFGINLTIDDIDKSGIISIGDSVFIS